MSITSLPRTPGRFAALSALDRSQRIGLGITALIHLVALGTLFATEHEIFHLALATLTWIGLNLFFLSILRRPLMSAVLSLGSILIVIAVSLFKFEVTWMTVTFLDLLILDSGTVAFLLKTFPNFRLAVIGGLIAAVPLTILIWRTDPFRVRRAYAALGGTACLALLGVMSIKVPEQAWEPFQGINHVSSFVRSGFTSLQQLSTLGWMEADAALPEKLKTVPGGSCAPAEKPPHIIMVLDESSFDVSTVPGMQVPVGYKDQFRSFDGKTRSFLVEGTGGPTWYTEYNVLSGLSARSFGKMQFYVTRIAANRVQRGLPQTLRRCGYKTFSLYPAPGSFLSARAYQHSAGIGRMIDSKEMRAGDVEPDHFYYDQALRVMERERGEQPLFMFVYTVANHFPWDKPYRADLTPGWRDPGNGVEIDEYMRRQKMSAQDYADFVERLQRKFPKEPFLIVRFGDHQPYISSKMIDPGKNITDVSRSIAERDQRYFTTYYAIDAVNYRPKDVSSAVDKLDAPYLPLAVLEAAGLPLDASFAEQKAIMKRCGGVFYDCKDGAEARRFNRLLIDAGLIKGL
ncbi:MAG TPA: LTA synthase family protein [Pseudorhodoplanes sp.]|nr:LTA synthase family protein [Pseudorhodoplanes sp.]